MYSQSNADMAVPVNTATVSNISGGSITPPEVSKSAVPPVSKSAAPTEGSKESKPTEESKESKPTEVSKSKEGPKRDRASEILLGADMKIGEGYVTPLICRQMEMANVLHTVTNLIAFSSSDNVLGEANEYIDPICETLRRVKAHSVPVLIERTAVPGMPSTKESIPLRDMIIDDGSISDLLNFLIDNKHLVTKQNYTSITAQLNAWTGHSIDFDGCIGPS